MKRISLIVSCISLLISQGRADTFTNLVVTNGAQIGGNITTTGTSAPGNILAAGNISTPSGSLTVGTTANIGGNTSVGGNVSATGNITSNSGRIYASSFLQAGTYVQAGTALVAGSYVQSGDYVQAGTYVQSPIFKTPGNTASGNLSVALGAGTSSTTYGAVVIGRNNMEKQKDGTTTPPAASASAWNDNDPLFVVGNGTGQAADPVEIRNRNAFIVYKDGTVKVGKAQGDILMGEFAP